MPDGSVRLIVTMKYIAGIYQTALSWDIHSYVEVGYAGQLCLANCYEEVYSWDMPSMVIITDMINNRQGAPQKNFV